MERTLIILKPDAVQRGLMGRIISRFEAKGLHIVGAKFMLISPELAEQHYADHEGKPFYRKLLTFMSSSPVMVLAVSGVGAIAVSRNLMGTTFGAEASPGTIRGDFGVSQSLNLVHGSDSPESAKKELSLFFGDDELIAWDRASDPWVYDFSNGDPS